MLKFSNVEDLLIDLEAIEGTDYGLSDSFDFLKHYSFVQFIRRYPEFYPARARSEEELVRRINAFIKNRSNILFTERNVDVQDNLFTIWKYAELPSGVANSMAFVGVEDTNSFIDKDKYQRLMQSGLILCVYDRESRSSRHYANSPY